MTLNKTVIDLAEELGKQLLQKGWSISCAESCTGGGIGYAITSISGSSEWFQRGFITYSNEAKKELVGVSEQALIEHGAVSELVVKQMAQGAAKQANAQMAVAVSGVAGPTGGTPDKPVGTVWFGRYVDGNVSAQVKRFEGDRHSVRAQTIEFALQYCLEAL
ncbi:nicotinamide-nucleotide amidase [Paraneptunicella aestuarii]|uniref:nicotinamide-nucleotide amidase n=1 Tax=Paraneptunicella aestuarii TaxID=2831148 RepID=UPI001E50CCD9|nr:nicotinamide-nucleotide amidase [Paraneptunicella aestuarii]UAA37953.1 nicotinamide-nucleotide amidase [Paraneptunicella aestuarii]